MPSSAPAGAAFPGSVQSHVTMSGRSPISVSFSVSMYWCHAIRSQIAVATLALISVASKPQVLGAAVI